MELTNSPFKKEIKSMNLNRSGKIFANLSIFCGILVTCMILGWLFSWLLAILVFVVCLLVILLGTIFTLGIVWASEGGRKFMGFFWGLIVGMGDVDPEIITRIIFTSAPYIGALGVVLGTVAIVLMAVSKKRSTAKIILTGIFMGISALLAIICVVLITQGALY